MKKNLKILGVEDTKEGRTRVTAQGKKYARINTSDGWKNCFNTGIIEELKKNMDKTMLLELSGDGEYFNKNIKEIALPGDKEDEETITGENNMEVPVVKPGENTTIEMNWKTDKPQPKTYPKDPVGLAVEVFGSMPDGQNLSNETLMDLSIKLVKQAQKAFE